MAIAVGERGAVRTMGASVAAPERPEGACSQRFLACTLLRR